MAEEVKEEGVAEKSSTTPKSSGSNKTATIIIVVVVGLIVILGVGGYFISRYFAKKIGEKTAETLIGATTGGAVDVDTSNNSIKIKGEDGNLEVGTSTWPSSMPSDVPKFPSGKINYSSADTNQKSWGVGYEAVESSAYDTYKSTLTSSGWTLSNETDIGLVKVATFEKSTISLSISIDSDSKGASLTVTGK